MKNLPGMMSRRGGLAGALIVGAAMFAAPGAASAAEALNCPTPTTKTIQDLSAGGGLWTVKSKTGGEWKFHVDSFKPTNLSAAWKATGTVHAQFEGDQLHHPTGYGRLSGEVHLAPGRHDEDSLAVVTILIGGMGSPANAPAQQYYFASLSGTFDLNSNTITGTYHSNRGPAGEAFVMTKDVPHNCPAT